MRSCLLDGDELRNLMKKLFMRALGSGSGIPTPFAVSIALLFASLMEIFFLKIIPVGFLSGIFLGEIIGVLGAALLIAYLVNVDFKKFFPMKRSGYSFVIVSLMATFFGFILTDYMLTFTGVVVSIPDAIVSTMQAVLAAPNGVILAEKIAILCVIPAICEEFLFRGLIQKAIMLRFGVISALIIQALIFAVMHGNLWYIHIYFLLGLFLGWIYFISGNLLMSILCHMANNVLTLLFAFWRMDVPMNGVFTHIDAIIAPIVLVTFIFSIWLLTRIVRTSRYSS